jgi:hypothetical protein
VPLLATKNFIVKIPVRKVPGFCGFNQCQWFAIKVVVANGVKTQFGIVLQPVTVKVCGNHWCIVLDSNAKVNLKILVQSNTYDLI